MTSVVITGRRMKISEMLIAGKGRRQKAEGRNHPPRRAKPLVFLHSSF
jgi:hypothetical protein